MRPDLSAIYRATEATWPPARRFEHPGVTLRDGAGGGKRVSAATVGAGWTDETLDLAESGMRDLGQTPLFMIRDGEDTLDESLAARGYEVIDPVNAWVTPVGLLTERRLPRVTAFTIWEPLAIMREIWAAGGIGDARLDVMARVEGPKTGLFGRISDKPAGAGFCGIDNGIAMVHALEIAAPYRRQGLGVWMMRAAALWAEAEGAEWLAVLCTRANAGANGLYASLGFETIGGYHYRILPEEEATS